MNFSFSNLLLLIIFGFFSSASYTQFKINGLSTKDNCNCYTLTPDVNNQYGSVWNVNKISLNNSFDFKFEVFLGNNGPGADGIAFVLQPISTNVGSLGGGMGYQGITPAMGITIDTYQNPGELAEDHIAIQLNGDIDHTSANNVAGPVQASATNANIEDGAWHDFRVSWNATSKDIAVYFDGSLRLTLNKDIVADVFANQDSVFWGFTGSTGGAKNLQRFCTQNDADFTINTSVDHCEDNVITITDQSSSFGHIEEWNWDFGDGTTTVTTTSQNMSHTYSDPGNYTINLSVKGNDGCISDTFEFDVQVYPKPDGQATVTSPVCEGDKIVFSASGGNSYLWKGVNGFSSTKQSDSILSASLLDEGQDTVIVTSNHGCKDTATVSVEVNPLPSATIFGDTTVCQDSPSPVVTFIGSDASSPYTFTYDDNGIQQTISTNPAEDTATINVPTSTPGTYTYSLLSVQEGSVTSCTSTSNGTVNITIQATPTVSFSASPLSGGAPHNVVFTNSPTPGNDYHWIFGDGSSLINNNVEVPHTFKDIGVYTTILVAVSPIGCTDSATILITVLNPKMEYQFPNVFSPNGDGNNDFFHLINPNNIHKIEITILNRWGNVVFTSSEINFNWNGTLNNTGGLCDDATYFYKATLTDINGEDVTEHGFVQLLKGK